MTIQDAIYDLYYSQRFGSWQPTVSGTSDADKVNSLIYQYEDYYNIQPTSPEATKWAVLEIDTRNTETPSGQPHSSDEFSIRIPIYCFYPTTVSARKMEVLWGDGSLLETIPLNHNTVTNLTHTYTTPGIYEVAIRGFLGNPGERLESRYNSLSSRDKLKLIKVLSGPTYTHVSGLGGWVLGANFFNGCSNLDYVPPDWMGFRVASISGSFTNLGTTTVFDNTDFRTLDFSTCLGGSAVFGGTTQVSDDVISNFIQGVANTAAIPSRSLVLTGHTYTNDSATQAAISKLTNDLSWTVTF